MSILFQITFTIGLVVLNIGFSAGIAGGRRTTVVEQPYMVQVRDNSGSTYCGGTLIRPRFVVTAASCVSSANVNQTVIVGGTGKLDGNGVNRRVRNITIHPNYNQDTFLPDLAVIELRNPMEGPNIRPLPLCSAALRSGDILQVSGWGKLSATSFGMPRQLQTVRLQITRKAACLRAFGKYVRGNMYCTSGAQGRGHCYGDTGGPGVYRGELCGVQAFSGRCGVPGHKSAFTGIFPFIAFIKRVIAAAQSAST